MADLWLARATGIEGFERHVAVKRIRKEQAADQRFVKMFLDEARIAAALHHDNIATVHDIGQEGTEYFFAMEYVHGEDLRKILTLASAREEQLPIEHVMTIVLAVSSALHYAHEHKSQVVHRDVSPANIIVGYVGHVKVVDFGIAKAAHRLTETQSGVMKGKTAYMSPEQCVGQPVDRRTDIFSLGIVLYELLTVRRMFKAANDFLTMSAIIHGDIPPPSSIRPGIPAELEAVVMRALAPDPADRFQTADEMRAAIERFCDAYKIRVSQIGLADYIRRLCGSRPEPWLSDDALDVDLSIDFDGTLPGVVKVPEAALKRAALPAGTPVQPSAPIMRARTKAITEPPPGATPVPVAMPPIDPDDDGPEVPLPAHEGSLSVGDQTLIVRASTTAPKLGRALFAIAAVTIVSIIAAVLVIWKLQQHEADEDDPTAGPAPGDRPEIRLPPPTTVHQVVPVDAGEMMAADAAIAETPADAAVDAHDRTTQEIDVATGSDEPPRQVKLRERPKKKKQKRPHRPPTDTDPEPWDPAGLFPKK